MVEYWYGLYILSAFCLIIFVLVFVLLYKICISGGVVMIVVARLSG